MKNFISISSFFHPSFSRSKLLHLLITVITTVNVTGIAILLLGVTKVSAAVPTDFQTTPIISTGLNGPTAINFAPDGRLFILEREGKVKIFKNNQLLPTPFVDLHSVASGDRGLIGVAFDPNFAVNHYVYFYFTAQADIHNRLVRFDASGDVAVDAGTVIYITNYNSDGLHVGGGLVFGPDGKIYLGIGDNGDSSAAQNYNTQQGKILRINADGSNPSDNPYVGQAGKLPEIWAGGLRNPWRLKFDNSTGRLYTGDVGGGGWEEINVIVKGANYGWPICEGMCNNANFVNPLYTYDHSAGGASVTFGLAYTGDMFPSSYKNRVFFGDYTQGFIKTLGLDQNGNFNNVQNFDTAAGSVVDMQQGADGSLYYVTFYPGRVYRVTYNPVNQLPIANASANVIQGTSPLTVKFSSLGSKDPNGVGLTYKWDFGDGTTSTLANPTKIYLNDGLYTAQLKVTNNVSTTTSLPIVIQVGIPPTITFFSPDPDSTYKAGDTITCNVFGSLGSGKDANDNNIVTYVILHHNIHIHPFLGPIIGKECTFDVPTVGESDPNTWYEIKTTVTDSIGLSTTKSTFIYPIKTNYTLNTFPQGLQISLEGSPLTTPQTIQGVVNFQRTLSVTSPQLLNGKYYQFDHWSDNGAITHNINVSPDVASYTAFFTQVPDYTAQYFNNKTLSGNPILSRSETTINNDWGGGSPNPVVTNDNFSARWIKTQNLTAGTYKFTVTADDGVRLYLDGQVIIDKWIDQPATTYTISKDIADGSHEIKMEYFENGGNAVAKLDIVKNNVIVIPPASGDGFIAQYFNNIDLSGSTDLVRNENAINNDWGGGSPDPVVHNDNFSARWIKNQNFLSGNYTFTVTGDDGIRLYLDGQLILDKWVDQAPTIYNISKDISFGAHEIKLEYYERGGGAVAKLSFVKNNDTVPPVVSPDGYLAEFWNTVGNFSMPNIPTTQPTLTRTDANINFDWGGGSPDPIIHTEGFIARWTKLQNFEEGTYKFETVSDDGIRVYVDNALVINQWDDHAPKTNTATQTIPAGNHTVRVEYYENGGGAVVKFNITKLNSVTGSFSAQYYNNRTLSGDPVLTRSETYVNYNWGGGSPDPVVTNDNFSARWVKNDTFTAGDHSFTITGDDGMRLYIDGQIAIDKWIDQAASTYTVVKNLTAGQHEIKLEYYENGGNAVSMLNY